MTLTKDEQILAFTELVEAVENSSELRDFIEMWTQEMLKRLENKKGD